MSNTSKKRNITKRDIAKYIAPKVQISENESYSLVDSIMSFMSSSLSESEMLNIKNFGKFVRTMTCPRIGRNPKTMVEYKIHSRPKVKFIPSKKLKLLINDPNMVETNSKPKPKKDSKLVSMPAPLKKAKSS